MEEEYEDDAYTFDEDQLILHFEQMLKREELSYYNKRQFLFLINHYKSLGDEVTAMSVVKMSLNQHPYSVELYVQKAKLLSNIEAYNLALEALEVALIYEPQEMNIYVCMADIHMRKSEFNLALEVLDQALGVLDADDWVEISLLKASVLQSAERFKEAFELLLDQGAELPDYELLHRRIWWLGKKLGAYEQLIPYYDNLLNEAAYTAYLWFYLAQAQEAVGLYEQALYSYDYVIVIDEKYEEGYLPYIRCALILERQHKAFELIDDYLQLFRAKADFWYSIAGHYLEQSNYRRALHFYGKALRIDHIHGRVYAGIARANLGLAAYVKAQRAAELARAADQYSADFSILLAECYISLEQYDQAQLYFHKGVELDRERIEHWLRYLVFLLDIEECALAWELLMEAQSLCEDKRLDFLEVVTLMFWSKRQEAFVRLAFYLEKHQGGEWILETFPYLMEDFEFMDIFRAHS